MEYGNYNNGLYRGFRVYNRDLNNYQYHVKAYFRYVSYTKVMQRSRTTKLVSFAPYSWGTALPGNTELVSLSVVLHSCISVLSTTPWSFWDVHKKGANMNPKMCYYPSSWDTTLISLVFGSFLQSGGVGFTLQGLRLKVYGV